MTWFHIVLALVLIPIGALIWSRQHLRALYDHSSTSTDLIFLKSPTETSSATVVAAFLQIIAKYIPSPWTSAAKLKPHANGRDFALPEIRMRGPLRILCDDEERFRRALVAAAAGDQDTKKLNPLFLFSLSGPVLPLLMAERACPILPLGSVNTKNAFAILNPAKVRSVEALCGLQGGKQLTFEASFGGESRPGIRRKRGVECSVDMTISLGSEAIFKQTFWFLMFLKRNVEPLWDGQPGDSTPTGPQPSLAQAESVKALNITPAHPKLWAASCKDYNPIHVSKLGAKLFGFPSVIAHGNLVIALVFEQLNSSRHLTAPEKEDAFTQAAKMLWNSERKVEIQVRFVRPVILPVFSEVGWTKENDDEYDFVVGKGEKTFTSGTCRYID